MAEPTAAPEPIHEEVEPALPPLELGLDPQHYTLEHLLRKLVEAEGPMKAALAPLAEPLAELARFDELRHLMAHAEVETAKSASGANLYIFRMIRVTKGEPEQLSLAIDHLEANTLNQRLALLVKQLTARLDTISKKRKTPVHPVAVAIPV